MQEKIAVGLGTIAGLVGAAAAALVPLVGELADATRPLGVPAEVWPIVSAALLAAVVLGRMGQAVAAVLRRPAIIEAEPLKLPTPGPSITITDPAAAQAIAEALTKAIGLREPPTPGG